MKKIIIPILCVSGLVLWVACATKSKISPKKESAMLMGRVNKNDFLTPPYQQWFRAGYDSYSLNPQQINTFSSRLKDYDIEIYMGTWCGDSRREVPAFYKILEAADFSPAQIKAYAVNRKKISGIFAEKGKNITHVPTFIFYKDNQEVGRIVESPINSLEQDISDIVRGVPQKPNYAN